MVYLYFLDKENYVMLMTVAVRHLIQKPVIRAEIQKKGAQVKIVMKREEQAEIGNVELASLTKLEAGTGVEREIEETEEIEKIEIVEKEIEKEIKIEIGKDITEIIEEMMSAETEGHLLQDIEKEKEMTEMKKEEKHW